MSRVLSTEQAKAAIGQVQSIINGGFTDQISALDAQGRVLSDPNIWDGPLAAQFYVAGDEGCFGQGQGGTRAVAGAAAEDFAGHLLCWRRRLSLYVIA